MLASSTPAAPAGRLPAVRVDRLPELDAFAPIDAAESLAGLPGRVLLESARPGRRSRWSFLTADPLVVLDRPGPGPDPFAEARRAVDRLDRSQPRMPDGPPFIGGLVGFIGYDLGAIFEPRPVIAADDQDLPALRLGLHDWAIAWDRRSGHAFLGGRAVDGDRDRLDRRLADVRERMLGGARPGPAVRARPRPTASSSARASTGRPTRRACGRSGRRSPTARSTRPT